MEQFTGGSAYIASDELLRSVEVARALGKPLLIKGEPGTGKTMLLPLAVRERMDLAMLKGQEMPKQTSIIASKN